MPRLKIGPALLTPPTRHVNRRGAEKRLRVCWGVPERIVLGLRRRKREVRVRRGRYGLGTQCLRREERETCVAIPVGE